VTEFRILVRRRGPLNDLALEIESMPAAAKPVAERIEAAIRDQLHFRAEVRPVAAGTLPRFELKSRRVVFEDA
jgi:phenylacetate-CoA ligase